MSFPRACSFLPFFAVLLSSGCMQTRSEVKEMEQRQVIQQQVSTIQKTNADAFSRFAETEEQLRNLNGRLEVVENQLQRENQQSQTQSKAQHEQMADMNKRSGLLQDSLVKLEQQIFTLQNEMTLMRSEHAALQSAIQSKAAAGNSQKGAKGSFEQAQELFKQKDWKRAILGYQKYRDDNPKGKSLAEATYRIGYSFQELGLKEEAESFYKELIVKYPKSEEAKKAKVKLKSLK